MVVARGVGACSAHASHAALLASCAMPCSLAVAKAYLALPVEGSDGAAASGGGESGGAFALHEGHHERAAMQRVACNHSAQDCANRAWRAAATL